MPIMLDDGLHYYVLPNIGQKRAQLGPLFASVDVADKSPPELTATLLNTEKNGACSAYALQCQVNAYVKAGSKLDAPHTRGDDDLRALCFRRPINVDEMHKGNPPSDIKIGRESAPKIPDDDTGEDELCKVAPLTRGQDRRRIGYRFNCGDERRADNYYCILTRHLSLAAKDPTTAPGAAPVLPSLNFTKVPVGTGTLC
eukprot:GEMP01062071.1.p1 GENE.GEMP01062071.1~~GEMP01062071.1.p1  ORF type:complete len:199 (+),score=44.96 GEMP01062071.1:179-775(+)